MPRNPDWWMLAGVLIACLLTVATVWAFR